MCSNGQTVYLPADKDTGRCTTLKLNGTEGEDWQPYSVLPIDEYMYYVMNTMQIVEILCYCYIFNGPIVTELE